MNTLNFKAVSHKVHVIYLPLAAHGCERPVLLHNQQVRGLDNSVTDEILWESRRSTSPQMREFLRFWFSLDACMFQSLTLTLCFYNLSKFISILSSFCVPF